MTTKIYKLTSKKIAGGAMYLNYKAGFLQAIDVADAQPTDEQLAYLLNILPVREGQLAEVVWGSMVVAEIPQKTAKDKIKLFCAAYKEFRGIPYSPTQTEVSNLRTVLVTPELLDVFFHSPLMDFSIRNYIQRINVTRDIQKNGRDPKDRFPNEYDHKFYHSLPPDKLIKYQQHLRSLGWKLIKGRGWVLNP
jgi:hypothetical protein